MKKKDAALETYSHSFYSRGAEPMLDGIHIEKLVCGAVIPEYRSDDMQVLFFTEGQGTLRVNGQERAVQPGTLVRLFPYHITAVLPQGELVFYRCTFSLSVLMYLDIKKDFTKGVYTALESGDHMVLLHGADRQRVFDAMAEMLLEHQGEKDYYLSAVMGNMLRIIAMLDRSIMQEYKKNGAIKRSKAWQALQYMHMYFNTDGMDAATVAEVIGVTPMELRYMLRSLTGQGFSENLHDVRVRNACAMMHFEELSISFIAHYVGYSSLATFYRTFKKLRGATPEEYRNGVTGSVPVGDHRDTAWKLLLYLLENYSENIHISDAAEHFFMGEETLINICEKNFGISFTELLSQIRLRYACSLLAVKQLNIQDIMLATGYSSMRTFTRRFKEYTGTTPLRYRETLIGGGEGSGFALSGAKLPIKKA